MSRITREALLSRFARKTLEVPDPVTGEMYVVQTMSLAEKDQYDALINRYDGKGGRSVDLSNFRGPMLAFAVAEPKLTAAEWGELAPAKDDSLDFLVAAAQRFNGYLADAVKEAEKNSEGGQPASSSSDSQGT